MVHFRGTSVGNVLPIVGNLLSVGRESTNDQRDNSHKIPLIPDPGGIPTARITNRFGARMVWLSTPPDYVTPVHLGRNVRMPSWNDSIDTSDRGSGIRDR